MTSPMTINGILKAMPKNWRYGVACSVAAGLILGFLTGKSIPLIIASGVLAGIAAFIAVYFIAKHDVHLRGRVEANAPFAWDVWMNGVKIGFITDAQYAAMQREAFGDIRLVVAQALNVGRVALNIAGNIAIAVPVVVFWIIVVAMLVSPETVKELWGTLLAADLEAQMESLRYLIHLVVMSCIAATALMGAMQFRFGFRNRYTETVAGMIRQLCNTPMEADVYLSKFEMTEEFRQLNSDLIVQPASTTAEVAPGV
nr:hypothetical protein [Stenotrophomonas pavanii]